MSEFFEWLASVFVIAALALTVWWFTTGPSERTRARIADELRPRGLKPISIKPKPEMRFGRSSRCILAVRAENPFGNVQVLYFDVDVWTDLFARHPRVRELGSGLSPTRFLLGDP